MNETTNHNHYTAFEAVRTLVDEGYALLATWPVREGVCTCSAGSSCEHPGKHPLSVVVPNGVNSATREQDVIRGWLTRFPDLNPAIATGEKSGVFVLDVDPKRGGYESLEALVRENGPLLTTRTATTPSGGMHLYFTYPGTQVRNSADEIAEGLDIRGDGGYVVAPPSKTNMGEYEYVDASTPVAEAPDWLVRLVTSASREGKGVDLRSTLNGLPQGSRDTELFRAACKLRADGHPIEVAQAFIAEAARKCEPPFDYDTAMEKLQRAYTTYDVRQYPLSDVGNARRFINQHGNDVRYSTVDEWLVWDQVRWQKDEAGRVTQKAISTIEAINAEGRKELLDGNREAGTALVGHALRSQRAERIRAMEGLARTEPGITVQATEFDKDPMLFNCPNGTLDLRTGELRSHDRGDLIMKLGGTTYDPGATAPRFDAFLERVLPDPDVRAYLQRAVGYSLTGLTTEQALFFLYGHGQNGKSKFVGIVQLIMGDYGKPAPPHLLMENGPDSHPTGLASLMGARFVPTIETSENKRLAETDVKWMTGGDKLVARKMRQDHFEFEPQFKLWLAGNYKPRVNGTDFAIWRRIHMVPFSVTIPDEERDPKLLDKLAAEATGVLRWAVEGCLEWQRVGLQPPSAVLKATAQYREDMDVIGQFMNECTEEARGSRLPAKDLYLAYEGWCEVNGERAMSQRNLTTKLRDMDYAWDTGRANTNVWVDLRLTAEGMVLATPGARSGFGGTFEIEASFRGK